MTGTLDIIYDRTDLPPCPVSLPDGVKTTATLHGSVRLTSELFGTCFMFPTLNATTFLLVSLVVTHIVL